MEIEKLNPAAGPNLACRPAAHGPRGLARLGMAQRLGPLSPSAPAWVRGSSDRAAPQLVGVVL
jgi:hypothetical protein